MMASGKPGIFLAGADLSELVGLPDESAARAVTTLGHDILQALESLPFPTAAVLDGAALGGGLEVALACDFRIAGLHPKCRMGLPEVKLGLIPGWGGTQRPSRIVGALAAAELVCSGEPRSACDALSIGLIDELSTTPVDAAERWLTLPSNDWRIRRTRKASALPSVNDFGDLPQRIAALAEPERTAASAALQLVKQGASLPLRSALALETETFVPLLLSEPARARMRGFLKK